MQPASSVPNVAAPWTAGTPLPMQERSGIEQARLLIRGPLASRAHRLLGLGAAGSARLGQSMPAMIAAFGGDAQTFHQTAAPWIAARSLARPVETLQTQSSVSWLLGTRGS